MQTTKDKPTRNYGASTSKSGSANAKVVPMKNSSRPTVEEARQKYLKQLDASFRRLA